MFSGLECWELAAWESQPRFSRPICYAASKCFAYHSHNVVGSGQYDVILRFQLRKSGLPAPHVLWIQSLSRPTPFFASPFVSMGSNTHRLPLLQIPKHLMWWEIYSMSCEKATCPPTSPCRKTTLHRSPVQTTVQMYDPTETYCLSIAESARGFSTPATPPF